MCQWIGGENNIQSLPIGGVICRLRLLVDIVVAAVVAAVVVEMIRPVRAYGCMHMLADAACPWFRGRSGCAASRMAGNSVARPGDTMALLDC